ncbi:MAG: hypothetical protein U1E36_02035 [Rickettsiales bacterium]
MRVFRFFLSVLTLLLGLTVCLAGLKYMKPTMYSSITISGTSLFGATSKEEAQRQEKIMILPISNEKKTILINHKIFEGASSHMVELALGEPKQSYPPRVQDGRSYTYWKYHFPNDNRPTMLIFQDGKLMGAQKVPARTASMQ